MDHIALTLASLLANTDHIALTLASLLANTDHIALTLASLLANTDHNAATPKWLYNRLCHSDQELSKSWRASKSHQWFKSYGHFTEGVDFVYRWSCIGKGLRLQPAQQACFNIVPFFYCIIFNAPLQWPSRWSGLGQMSIRTVSILAEKNSLIIRLTVGTLTSCILAWLQWITSPVCAALFE